MNIVHMWFVLFSGDPTVFGNLLPAEQVKEAVIRAVQSDKYNGYAPSVGKLDTRPWKTVLT